MLPGSIYGSTGSLIESYTCMVKSDIHVNKLRAFSSVLECIPQNNWHTALWIGLWMDGEVLCVFIKIKSEWCWVVRWRCSKTKLGEVIFAAIGNLDHTQCGRGIWYTPRINFPLPAYPHAMLHHWELFISSRCQFSRRSTWIVVSGSSKAFAVVRDYFACPTKASWRAERSPLHDRMKIYMACNSAT